MAFADPALMAGKQVKDTHKLSPLLEYLNRAYPLFREVARRGQAMGDGGQESVKTGRALAKALRDLAKEVGAEIPESSSLERLATMQDELEVLRKKFVRSCDVRCLVVCQDGC